MDSRIRPLWRGASLAGPAFTVRTPPGEHPSVRRALEEAEAGQVIVVDGGGSLERALWGGKMSRRALERGIAGLVVDGAVRDVDEIEELGFPVFALAAAPTPPLREHEGELGAPIMCGGRAVAPGDLVYGDADGVVVVPQAVLAEILERARTS
jgi:RraA family protein